MLEKIIKKEVKDEEEEEEEETDEEEEEKELEGEGVGGKGLSVEEEWKLRHTEEGKTEPTEKLGKTIAVVHLWLVVTLGLAVYICIQPTYSHEIIRS